MATISTSDRMTPKALVLFFCVFVLLDNLLFTTLVHLLGSDNTWLNPNGLSASLLDVKNLAGEIFIKSVFFPQYPLLAVLLVIYAFRRATATAAGSVRLAILSFPITYVLFVIVIFIEGLSRGNSIGRLFKHLTVWFSTPENKIDASYVGGLISTLLAAAIIALTMRLIARRNGAG